MSGSMPASSQSVTTPGSWPAHSLPFYGHMHVVIHIHKVLDHDGPKLVPDCNECMFLGKYDFPLR